MSGSGRRALGAFGIVAYLTVYIAAAATLGSYVVAMPWWAQVPFFLLAGIVWVLPLRPIFAWMNKSEH